MCVVVVVVVGTHATGHPSFIIPCSFPNQVGHAGVGKMWSGVNCVLCGGGRGRVQAWAGVGGAQGFIVVRVPAIAIVIGWVLQLPDRELAANEQGLWQASQDS